MPDPWLFSSFLLRSFFLLDYIYFKIFQILLAALWLLVFWTILTYHSQYYWQIQVQVMLLPIHISPCYSQIWNNMWIFSHVTTLWITREYIPKVVTNMGKYPHNISKVVNNKGIYFHVIPEVVNNKRIYPHPIPICYFHSCE